MSSVAATALSAAETVFAQLCLDTTDIVIAEPHVIDVVGKDASGVPAASELVSISMEDFKKAFYGNVTAGDNSSFQLTGSAASVTPYYDLANAAGKYGLLGNAAMGVLLPEPVSGYWAKDIGKPIDCWATCSRMAIFKEVQAAHNLKNLDCNICCSLCWGELADMVQVEQGLDMRAAATTGAKLGLRVLFKNDHEGTKDVEVRLHFVIA